MKKGKKKGKKRDKKGYKECSVKGCRKKAVMGGKCQKHGRRKLPPRKSLKKKLSAPSLRHTAKKIKRLSESVDALSRKAKKRVPRSREGCLNALFFEVGVISEKISRLIKQDK